MVIQIPLTLERLPEGNGIRVNLEEPCKFHVVIIYLLLIFPTSGIKQRNLTKALTLQSLCSINKLANIQYATWWYMP